MDASVLVPAIIGTAFISAVVSLMTYPLAGWRYYHAYKRPLFIAGVVFMPLFAYVAALLRSGLPLETKAAFLIPGMFFFWLSGAILAWRGTHGPHVPGLKFRPDYILPGGVNLVKGIILVGIGLLISFQPEFKLPAWNWWGFVLAFWGIIAVIPVRGMYKMSLRMQRLVDLPRSHQPAAIWWREILLVAGLMVLLYGFINAFMGAIPFTTLVPKTAKGLPFILLSWVILVPLRGLYKLSIPEGAESWEQTVAKQLFMAVGVLSLLYGYVTTFMGGFMTWHPDTNPRGMLLGLSLAGLGLSLMVPARSWALRNEWQATIANMMGVLSELSVQERRSLMGRRMAALYGMTEGQRRQNMRAMGAGLSRLGERRRLGVVRTMVDLLAEATPDFRRTLMASNAAALGTLSDGERQKVMTGMMSAVSELPEEQRKVIMGQMVALVA